MTQDNLLRLLHVLSVGLYAGGLVAMLMVQSLLQRALEEPERRSLARVAHQIARTFVNPLVLVGFLSGLFIWVERYGVNGMGKLMACSPVYVHIMLGFGFLIVGFTQVWKAKARQLAAALDSGRPFSEAKALLLRGWVFALLALVLTLATFAVAILKVPNPPRTRCGEAAVVAPAERLPA